MLSSPNTIRILLSIVEWCLGASHSLLNGSESLMTFERELAILSHSRPPWDRRSESSYTNRLITGVSLLKSGVYSI